MKAPFPWKWSEDGCQLIDNAGRTVLRIRPSDATQDEFDLIRLAPELFDALVRVITEARMHPTGVQDRTAREAEAIIGRVGKG